MIEGLHVVGQEDFRKNPDKLLHRQPFPLAFLLTVLNKSSFKTKPLRIFVMIRDPANVACVVPVFLFVNVFRIEIKHTT